MGRSGLLFDQINQSFGISEGFWIAVDSAKVPEDPGDSVKPIMIVTNVLGNQVHVTVWCGYHFSDTKC